jgi:hypothetical protein
VNADAEGKKAIASNKDIVVDLGKLNPKQIEFFNRRRILRATAVRRAAASRLPLTR